MNVSSFSQMFLLEAGDLLATIESTSLLMGNDTTGLHAVDEVFRAFHTLKGNAAMFGFAEAAEFAQHIELLLAGVRNGAVTVSPQLSKVTLAAASHVRLLLIDAREGSRVHDVRSRALLVQVEELQGTASLNKA